ncbi:MAG TPA: type II secretion system major pseudopilin GspG [Spirochaetota bacterium]
MIKKLQRISRTLRMIWTDRSGYNLIELMIVIMIIGILAILVVPRLMDLPTKARIQKAKSDIASISLALSRYNLDNGSYPSTEQGLLALVEKPSSDPVPQNYNEGGYLEKKTVPVDPWNHPYTYRSPGDNGADYEIVCLGADGKEGGEGENSDIKSGGN